MKKIPKYISLLYVLILITLSSCDNPLNRIYKPISYEKDLKKIERYNRFAAKKIEFVIEYELPKYGTTYQELSDRFNEIQEEVQAQDSLLKMKLKSLENELDSITKKINSQKISL